MAEAVGGALAAELGLDVPAMAEGVLRVAISGMLVAVEQLLARAGAHASELTLMPFGGAGPMLGALLAEAAGIRRVLVPANPGTLCALGALAAGIRRDTMRTVLLPLDAASWPLVEASFAELAAQAAADVAEMAGPGISDLVRTADMRYRGQSYELTAPADGVDGPDALAALFHAAHEASFGHAEPGAPVQVVSLRVAASRPAPPVELPWRPAAPHRPVAARQVRLRHGGAWHAADLYGRAALDPGAAFTGPAIVTQADCTVLIPPGWQARVDGFGNIEMEQG
jgi:N-methylhydantoinase A